MGTVHKQRRSYQHRLHRTRHTVCNTRHTVQLNSRQSSLSRRKHWYFHNILQGFFMVLLQAEAWAWIWQHSYFSCNRACSRQNQDCCWLRQRRGRRILLSSVQRREKPQEVQRLCWRAWQVLQGQQLHPHSRAAEDLWRCNGYEGKHSQRFR